MHTSRYISLIIAAACASIASWCQAAQPLSPEQALSYLRIADLQFSPDGSQLAYVVVSYRWDALPRLQVTTVATGETRELTPALKSERAPQWSSDGKWLAFLSNRGGARQVYVVSSAGGEVTALTARNYGVEKFHWSPDGRRIAYLAKEDTAPEPGQGPQVADLEANLARLWVVDVSSKATRRLGTAGYGIDDFQWQDTKHLLVTATDRPDIEEHTNKVYGIATDEGAFRPIATPPQPFDSLLVSPDGKRFAVRSTSANGPIPRDLFVTTTRMQRYVMSRRQQVWRLQM
ncbi:MAG TPA: hypothetical protein VI653_15320 [Steroidobacteraceae bacterium]